MGITAKSKTKNSSENCGMGLLLVFFPEDNSTTTTTTTTTTGKTAINVDKAKPFSSLLPSSSSSSSNNNGSSSSSRIIKRTNSSETILTKTQSTITICSLLLFFSLLFFTLSTFEPTTTLKTSRRFLSEKPPYKPIKTRTSTKTNPSWLTRMRSDTKTSEVLSSSSSLYALQGMGKLYRRGTRATNDLIVGHVVEDISEDEFRVFLRVLHRSGLTARADVVFVFGSSSFASRFDALIQEENDSFLKLVHNHKELLNTTSHASVSASFDVTQFVKRGTQGMGEPLWGKRIRVNTNFNNSGGSVGELTRLSYGSVVGFEVSELDPENSLAGFLDHVPMSLRRWASYPMLLGRVRRNFKHVMLVDVKSLVLLRDPLVRVRNQSPESVYILTKQESSSSRHGRRNSEKTQSHCQVNSAILMGGARGIRRLSNAMLTEIVRAAMQHKKKSLVTDSAILSQMVSNGHILKNIDLITSTESIPDASSLAGLVLSLRDYYTIIQRGNDNHDLNSIIMKLICSCEVASSVYRDC